jgi:hypothetical protein
MSAQIVGTTEKVYHVFPNGSVGHLQSSQCPCRPSRDEKVERQFPERAKECWQHKEMR